MKKVLFVTYHFPPSGGSKTRRTLKFLKYLPDFSWQPVVLTMKGGKLFNFDPSLLDEIPREAQVHRVAILPLGFQENKKHLPESQVKERNGAFKKFQKQLKGFLNKWTAIPDEFIVWAPAAISYGIKLVSRENIDAVYSTAPPFSNHIVAAMIARFARKPLVLDFRDAWVSDPARKWRYSPKIRRGIEALLEKTIVRTAGAVVSTTDGITQDFRTRYPLEVKEKFLTITNGYDRDELKNRVVPNKENPEKMYIVHTGWLVKERSPETFLEALRKLLDERPELADKIEVHLIGESGKFYDGLQVEDYIEKFMLNNVVKLAYHLPRMEAMNRQMCADILLLIIGIVPKDEVVTYGIASKVFDYMLAQKPVLALADKGPVSELVERTEVGSVIEPSNVKSIKEFLSESFDRYTKRKLTVEMNITEIMRYDMEVLTEKLAEVLDSCKVRVKKKHPQPIKLSDERE
jgi:glycosyltransferase involved in cell wall biosynthesis